MPSAKSPKSLSKKSKKSSHHEKSSKAKKSPQKPKPAKKKTSSNLKSLKKRSPPKKAMRIGGGNTCVSRTNPEVTVPYREAPNGWTVRGTSTKARCPNNFAAVKLG